MKECPHFFIWFCFSQISGRGGDGGSPSTGGIDYQPPNLQRVERCAHHLTWIHGSRRSQVVVNRYQRIDDTSVLGGRSQHFFVFSTGGGGRFQTFFLEFSPWNLGEDEPKPSGFLPINGNLVGGVQDFSCLSLFGEDEPIWTTHIFQMGWLKPPTSFRHETSLSQWAPTWISTIFGGWAEDLS